MISITNSILKSILSIPRGTCRFSPSCSDYAHEAIEKLPLWMALLKISGRILRCHPFCRGGYDPVLRSIRKV